MELTDILKVIDDKNVKKIALKSGLINDLKEVVSWDGYIPAVGNDGGLEFATFVATQEDAPVPNNGGEKVQFQITTLAGQVLYCVEFH